MSSRPWESDEREDFRGRFGEDVDAYDATRPVAPGAVFDDIMRAARLGAGSRVVEIGPGTGQATRALAERGLEVTAVELDARLAARAAENLAECAAVEIFVSPFEAWDAAGRTFDAVFACNSFHWIDPDRRYGLAARLLVPGGALIVMSTPVVVPDAASRFWWDVQDDWDAVNATRVDPRTAHPDLVEDPAADVGASGLFGQPVVIRHRFDRTLTATQYAANLSTQSGVKEMPVEAQADLVERVRRRIASHGGSVKVHHLAVATIAARLLRGGERSP